MKIIEPSYEIIDLLDTKHIMKKLELCGRVCYKSEDNITDESSDKFIQSIISRGHESVLEHVSFSVRFIVDRGVSHEIVRHRICSFSQESTRYCNFSKEKFGNEITVIKPNFFNSVDEAVIWEVSCKNSEGMYFRLLDNGMTPEQARSVLPNSLKTELIMTANIREWRHFLKLRTSTAAHPQLIEVTIPLLEELKSILPVLFSDI